MSDYLIECVDIECLPGTHIHEQKRLACLAAIENRCNVRFVHNDRVYLVSNIKLREQCREIKVSDKEVAQGDDDV